MRVKRRLASLARPSTAWRWSRPGNRCSLDSSGGEDYECLEGYVSAVSIPQNKESITEFMPQKNRNCESKIDSFEDSFRLRFQEIMQNRPKNRNWSQKGIGFDTALIRTWERFRRKALM